MRFRMFRERMAEQGLRQGVAQGYDRGHEAREARRSADRDARRDRPRGRGLRSDCFEGAQRQSRRRTLDPYPRRGAAAHPRLPAPARRGLPLAADRPGLPRAGERLGDGGHPGRGERGAVGRAQRGAVRVRRAAHPRPLLGRPGRRPPPARGGAGPVRTGRGPAGVADQQVHPVRGGGPGRRPGPGRAVHRRHQLAGRPGRHPPSDRAGPHPDRRDQRAHPDDVQPCPDRRLPRRHGDGRAARRLLACPGRGLPPRGRLPPGPGAAAPPRPPHRDLRGQRPPGAGPLRGRPRAGAAHPRGPQCGRLRRPAGGPLGGPAADDRTAAADRDGRGGGQAGARTGQCAGGTGGHPAGVGHEPGGAVEHGTGAAGPVIEIFGAGVRAAP
ncbi:hypothetical protein SGPA1_12463 [Streptomyces misionensis JCM 4497]